MMVPLTPILISRLEKAAVDNGFDQEWPRDREWLCFGSTQCPLRIWLSALGESIFVAAFSQHKVLHALGEHASVVPTPMPSGAPGACSVPGIPALHRLLRRAFQLSRSLPDELFHSFEKQIAALPRATEAERLVIQRVGQDLFRQGLLDYWDGRCAITGLGVHELLRASHIKPWADCTSDGERLDVFNGLLLAAHLDAAFDAGLITISRTGVVTVSSLLSEKDVALLGLEKPTSITALGDGHRRYLPWHWEHVFKGEPDHMKASGRNGS